MAGHPLTEHRPVTLQTALQTINSNGGMTVKSISIRTTIALFFFATGVTLFAQDTCKTYSVANPHGAAMDITKIWMVDTVNFTVRTIKSLPFHIGATESFDIEVCILARDGKPHTSQVRYQNTHGTSSYSVTITAPAVASVSDQKISSQTVHAPVPNPASDIASIEIPEAMGRNIVVRLYNVLGEDVTEIAGIRVNDRNALIGVKALPNGGYVVAVIAGNMPVSMQSLVVSH
ncbi:MAG: T9SS type A sorting domain-containing protein [Bacteroidota bacterium]